VANFFSKGKSEEQQDKVIPIDVEQINPNPFQPRKHFEAMQMEELSRSIAEKGIIQPIVVRQDGDRYEIVAGERRWRAAKMAGYKAVPAIVREYTDQELTEIALVENLQRADLSYFEEAEGYRRLIEEFRITQEEIAEKVGKSQPTIANKLRILRIDPAVKEQIMVELITERHVRALLKLKTPEEQLAILKEVYENELNVKDTEIMINDYLEGRTALPGEGPDEDEEPQEERKKQTFHRVFSDMRIYVNTIKAAVATIIDTGVDVVMDQAETEDAIQITVTISKV